MTNVFYYDYSNQLKLGAVLLQLHNAGVINLTVVQPIHPISKTWANDGELAVAVFHGSPQVFGPGAWSYFIDQANQSSNNFLLVMVSRNLQTPDIKKVCANNHTSRMLYRVGSPTILNSIDWWRRLFALQAANPLDKRNLELLDPVLRLTEVSELNAQIDQLLSGSSGYEARCQYFCTWLRDREAEWFDRLAELDADWAKVVTEHRKGMAIWTDAERVPNVSTLVSNAVKGARWQ